ncbi:hypothetical protein Tcan_00258 [Toxocara canis]|uniref:Uncharacterized protein n=1 Tax=Toxocara canis TaxID=6265 RepID=A0A0B2UY31_TOXCA|nr:hypothetical protein Tcan_00258 [Toxocara canis]
MLARLQDGCPGWSSRIKNEHQERDGAASTGGRWRLCTVKARSVEMFFLAVFRWSACIRPILSLRCVVDIRHIHCAHCTGQSLGMVTQTKSHIQRTDVQQVVVGGAPRSWSSCILRTEYQNATEYLT